MKNNIIIDFPELEEWKDIPEYLGIYQVSNYGRIKKIENDSSERIVGSKINCQDGYVSAHFKINGIDKTKKIHRIVALAFIPLIEGKNIVHHKNHIRHDNRAENLEWVTASENIQKYWETKEKKNTKRSYNKNKINPELTKFYSDDSIVLESEVWKNIVDYDGDYQISNYGRIKSFKFGREKLIKPYQLKTGYLRCIVSKKSITKGFSIHRMVAIYFVENPNNFPQVNHKDCNIFNNCADNLEWVTPLENTRHAINNNRCPRGEDSLRSKLSEKDVISIRELSQNGYSFRKLSKLFGVSPGAISGVVSRKNWKHI